MAKDPDFDRISAKAHELWEAEGHPHGRDQDHWNLARELVAIEDSQGDTLLPRDSGAEAPIEEPEAALRNLADMPNLTDQGENLLTSTDREPELTATPSGRDGEMPVAEVPTSGQPGISAKTRTSKAVVQSPSRPAGPPSTGAKAPPSKTVGDAKQVKPETVKPDAAPPRPAGRKKGK